MRMAGNDEVRSGLDWYAVRSDREDHCGARFVDCDFTELQRGSFSEVNFTEADFTNADLRNTGLRDCRLANIDWSGARLREADLRGSTLEGIEGEEFNVRGAVVDVAQALAIAEAHGAVIR